MLRHSPRDSSLANPHVPAVTSLAWVPTSFRPRHTTRQRAEARRSISPPHPLHRSRSSSPPAIGRSGLNGRPIAPVARPPGALIGVGGIAVHRPLPARIARAPVPGLGGVHFAPIELESGPGRGGAGLSVRMTATRSTLSRAAPQGNRGAALGVPNGLPATFLSIDTHVKRTSRMPAIDLSPAKSAQRRAAAGAAARADAAKEELVLCVEEGPPAVLLASASADGLVRLWDLRSLVCVVQFRAHSECVARACFAASAWRAIRAHTELARPPLASAPPPPPHDTASSRACAAFLTPRASDGGSSPGPRIATGRWDSGGSTTLSRSLRPSHRRTRFAFGGSRRDTTRASDGRRRSVATRSPAARAASQFALKVRATARVACSHRSCCWSGCRLPAA